MPILRRLWDKILGTAKMHDEVHQLKNDYSRTMILTQQQARKQTRDTAELNIRLDTTAYKIYRAIGKK